MSKGKKRAFQEWESCAPGLQDGRFMRLANSQMLHEKMRGLGGNGWGIFLTIATGFRLLTGIWPSPFAALSAPPFPLATSI